MSWKFSAQTNYIRGYLHLFENSSVVCNVQSSLTVTHPRTFEHFPKFVTGPLEKSISGSNVTHSAKCPVIIGTQMHPKCYPWRKIVIPDNLVHHDGSIIVTTFQRTLFLLNLFFFSPIYDHVFTLWFTVKHVLLDKPEKLFSLKTFQNPTALISTCYSVIVRFKFSGKWASY